MPCRFNRENCGNITGVKIQRKHFRVKFRMSLLLLHTNDVLITIMGQNKILNKIDNPEAILSNIVARNLNEKYRHTYCFIETDRKPR